MTEHPTRQITGEVFSASRFFERCAMQSSDSDGNLPFTLTLASSGVHQVAHDQGTLVWVDGVCADSIAQEHFMESVRCGEIPTPLRQRGTRTVQSRIVYTSPEQLARTRQTVLSVCGLVDAICDSALESPRCLCQRCGTTLARFHTAAELLATLLHRWRGRQISVYAAAPGGRFGEWAQSHGLSLQTNSRGTPSVRLDQCLCDEGSLTSISTLVHTAWRLPEIYFTCVSDTQESESYAAHGWCPLCAVTAGAASRLKLAALCLRGLDPVTPHSGEALLAYNEHYTVTQLLHTPVAELTSIHNPLISRATTLLGAVGLEGLSLGTRTDSVDGHHLARLSLVGSIIHAAHSHDHIVVDLPRYVLSGSVALAVQGLLATEGAQRGISIIGEPFTQHETLVSPPQNTHRSQPCLATLSFPALTHSGCRTYEVYAGEYLLLESSTRSTTGVVQEIATQISASSRERGIASQVALVPLFHPVSARAQVVGDELGILQGLSQLYAASLDARTHGLTAHDFTLFSSRSQRYVCERCRGLGVVIAAHPQLPRPYASPCRVCYGARCAAPVSTAMFRGVSFSTVLNQPIERSLGTMSALAKAARALELLRALDLLHLPLGMPCALLSSSELRRLSVACAVLRGRGSKPAIVVVEMPRAGFAQSHQRAVEKVRDAALKAANVAWIDIEVACGT